MELVHGMEDYGSAPGGESIYKDNKGYYIVKWDPKSQVEYRSYLSKKWKPNKNRTRIVLKCKHKNKGCKWTMLNSQTRKINKSKRTTTRRR